MAWVNLTDLFPPRKASPARSTAPSLGAIVSRKARRFRVSANATRHTSGAATHANSWYSPGGRGARRKLM
jgi:hypothetical protein